MPAPLSRSMGVMSCLEEAYRLTPSCCESLRGCNWSSLRHTFAILNSKATVYFEVYMIDTCTTGTRTKLSALQTNATHAPAQTTWCGGYPQWIHRTIEKGLSPPPPPPPPPPPRKTMSYRKRSWHARPVGWWWKKCRSWPTPFERLLQKTPTRTHRQPVVLASDLVVGSSLPLAGGLCSWCVV